MADDLLDAEIQLVDGALRVVWRAMRMELPALTLRVSVTLQDGSLTRHRSFRNDGPQRVRADDDTVAVTVAWHLADAGVLLHAALHNTGHSAVVLQSLRLACTGTSAWFPDRAPVSGLRVAYCGAHSRSATSRSHVVPLDDTTMLESWWVGALGGGAGPGLVVGGVKPERFVTAVAVARNGLTATFPLEHWSLAPGESVAIDPVWLGATAVAPHAALEQFATALGTALHARSGPSPSGWGSWGHWLERIDAGLMREMVHAIDGSTALRAAIDVVQIDDGWSELLESRRVSASWRPNGRFPSGIAPLATEIARTGRRCGLWLLPFTVNGGSPIVVAHPEWLVHDGDGAPLRIGGGDAYCLDPTHPGAAEWLTALLTQFRDWGVEYVKLDFLRALLAPDPAVAVDDFTGVRRYHGARTRLEAYRIGLGVIRRALGESTTVVACSAPAAAGVGLIDCHRIGPDIERSWTGRLAGVRDAARAVAANWFWQGRTWVNDPDYLLACESEPLTRFWATLVALSGGSVILSADLSTLEPWAESMLAFVMPPIGRAARPLDLFSHGPEPRRWALPLRRDDEVWTMLGVVNWGDRPLTERIDVHDVGVTEHVHVWDAWRQRHMIATGMISVPVEAQSAALLRLTPVTDVPTMVGTDVHWAQGWIECLSCQFDAATGVLHVEVAATCPRDGRIWIWVPEDWELASGALRCSERLAVAPLRSGHDVVINFQRPIHPPSERIERAR